MAAGSAVAFAPQPSFAPLCVSIGAPTASVMAFRGVCTCPACTGMSTTRSASCSCPACTGTSATRLFMSEEAEAEPEAAAEVPPEVEAMDGIESEDEAHNADRPARASLSKKTPATGKALTEFSVGDSVQAKVKSITSYGAFLDIGAATDGLLHISNLSSGFVSDVKEFLTEGQECEVRIMNIDADKNQIGLTLLTAEQEAEANQPRQRRGGGGGGGRRDDSKATMALADKGFDSSQFIEGTVASTVDFGAFVRFDASLLNSEVEGEMDGLVHISALTAGRADSVTAIVNTGDKVQIRCKAIDGRKVSLSMVSIEDEKAAMERRRESGRGGEPVNMGAKDWKESLERITSESTVTFDNSPLVVDLRK